MFTRRDIDQLDRSYFDVLGSSPFAITLRSQCTKHEWHILFTEGQKWQSCKIYHRHSRNDGWHWHGSKPTLREAIADIQGHDNYQLNGRK